MDCSPARTPSIQRFLSNSGHSLISSGVAVSFTCLSLLSQAKARYGTVASLPPRPRVVPLLRTRYWMRPEPRSKIMSSIVPSDLSSAFFTAMPCIFFPETKATERALTG